MAKDDLTVTLPLAADVAALFALAEERAIKGPFELPGGVTGYVIPDDMTLIEKSPVNPVLPDAVKQTESIIEPASFKDYVTQFKSPTAICRANETARTVVAVLDYHGRAREGDRDTAKPGLGQHVVTLSCPFDVDYAKWRKVLGEYLEQDAMITFLEDMIHTISEPAAADLIEAMSDIQIDRQVKFRSKKNDRNGNLVVMYAELDGDTQREGEFTLPDHVVIVVPIFRGGNLVQLTAKLRVRMDKGVLMLGFAVPGLEKIEREAFRSIAEDIRSATSTPVFYTA